MTLNVKESFERWCRLCAEEQEVTIMIFSTEAQAMLLHDKLNKYLLIEVDEDDRLPKNICIQCCTKLQTVCEFIDKVKKAQETLVNHSLVLKNLQTENWFVPPIKSEPESESDILDCTTKDLPMEVSVDPMMVLQNSDDLFMEENLNSNAEEVMYLNGVDGENVTIKLIQKADISNTSNDKTVSILKPFICITCDKGFYSEMALKNHSWVHFNEDKAARKYNCSKCHENFDFKCELIAHFKKHSTLGVCHLCGRNFRSEKNLSIHMAGHMSKCVSYTCKICHRSYNTKSNLKTHSITHSNERPYKCHLCKKSFKRNQDLKFHINQHTGAKPYKCPFCEKAFASSGNCYSHRSRMHPGRQLEGKEHSHTTFPDNQLFKSRVITPAKNSLIPVKGIFKYQCQLCEHSFMKRDNFMYHMYQHTGEKPFHCTFCPEKFVTRKGLLIHHDKEHPGKDRPLALISRNVLLK
ncbi:zinc finger protein 84-like [Battus philenor]|uniref:zinc finger protein 84-like n=1 Tax=Battus philenor TaxID=42288 RepID=UPI0035CF3BD4